MNLPSTIVYHSPSDKTKFDLQRFENSLKAYGEYDRDLMLQLLDEDSRFPVLHYSCLVSIGVKCLKNEEDAQRFYEDHQNESQGFERLRRITGYLVGSLERWNDGKKAEEKERVKHGIPANAKGVYTQEEKALREEAKKNADHMFGTI